MTLRVGISHRAAVPCSGMAVLPVGRHSARWLPRSRTARSVHATLLWSQPWCCQCRLHQPRARLGGAGEGRDGRAEGERGRRPTELCIQQPGEQGRGAQRRRDRRAGGAGEGRPGRTRRRCRRPAPSRSSRLSEAEAATKVRAYLRSTRAMYRCRHVRYSAYAYACACICMPRCAWVCACRTRRCACICARARACACIRAACARAHLWMPLPSIPPVHVPRLRASSGRQLRFRCCCCCAHASSCLCGLLRLRSRWLPRKGIFLVVLRRQLGLLQAGENAPVDEVPVRSVTSSSTALAASVVPLSDLVFQFRTLHPNSHSSLAESNCKSRAASADVPSVGLLDR